MSKIRVTAPEGRTCPIHPDDHVESGNVHVLKPGEELEVEDSPGIRRRIRSGDLVHVAKKSDEKKPATPMPDPELPTPTAAKSGR